MLTQIVSIFASIIALVIAFLTLKQLHFQTKGLVLLGCLENYQRITRGREKAITNRSKREAHLYYREICDLHWTEFKMWESGAIPDHVIDVWIRARHYDYKNEYIEFENNEGVRVIVDYKTVWDSLKKKGYFQSEDSFTIFMDLAHHGEIEKALMIPNGQRNRFLSFLHT
uniref:Uncharacterized protein n=1 Tax=Candidatus Kentrum sp. DK TaxID=2126562 RepID=A0A450T4F5_9GAMM|nr:MAG: hypothetical protein BECKDK2373B_GA0170837_110112 [Candidatus Kentron sp. DK]VFJ66588.1 MAG: hypothetical protein BECKDK2373C_GA0170839_11512 [Candidatus Kentron sp. DK]